MDDKKVIKYYSSFYEISKNLSQRQFYEFNMAIFDALFYQKHIDDIAFSDNILRLLWISVKHSISASIDGYCSKNGYDYQELIKGVNKGVGKGVDKGLPNNDNEKEKDNDKDNKKENIYKRKKIFEEKVENYVGKHPEAKSIKSSFLNYWTELNKSETRMRFEGETYFDIAKRIGTFLKNEKKFKQKTQNGVYREEGKDYGNW